MNHMEGLAPQLAGKKINVSIEIFQIFAKYFISLPKERKLIFELKYFLRVY